MPKFNILGHQSRFERLLSVVNFIAPLVKGHFEPLPFDSVFPILITFLFELILDFLELPPESFDRLSSEILQIFCVPGFRYFA